jgi:hypothetical protein
MKLLKFQALNILVVTLIGAFCCTNYDHDKPNTSANQKGFERHFGFTVPDSVTDLYYFADELGVDVTYRLGFKADQETIDKIVSGLRLTQGEPELVGPSLGYEFPWWDEQDIGNLTPYWKSNQKKDYYWLLWYNPASQRAYYVEFSL